ncbi:MAG: hypothetical protein WC661_06750 [Opitutaceae bacterium]|jgi:hypothetical protein
MKLRGRLSAKERARLGDYQLRLFASVDLEGSTAFKQNLSNRGGRAWLGVLLKFVEQFDQKFWAHVGMAARAAGRTMPPRPKLWKILGDELVFIAEIIHSTDAATYVDALASALKEWNAEVLAGLKASPPRADRQLRVKGAAWLADFPVTNAVLPVDGTHRDFVGPAMDAGFRLAKLASPRRLALSVDLVWLLLMQDKQREIQFAGRTRELKGLASDSGYPQLWIEIPASAYHTHEQAVLGPRRPPIPGEQLRILCQCFVADFGVPPHPPHLPAEASAYPASPDHKLNLQAAQEELATRYPDTGTEAGAAPRPKAAASPAELAAQADNPPTPVHPAPEG